MATYEIEKLAPEEARVRPVTRELGKDGETRIVAAGRLGTMAIRVTKENPRTAYMWDLRVNIRGRKHRIASRLMDNAVLYLAEQRVEVMEAYLANERSAKMLHNRFGQHPMAFWERDRRDKSKPEIPFPAVDLLEVIEWLEERRRIEYPLQPEGTHELRDRDIHVIIDLRSRLPYPSVGLANCYTRPYAD